MNSVPDVLRLANDQSWAFFLIVGGFVYLDRSKQLLQTLDGHTDVVLGVAAHPSRELIVTGGTDKDLKRIKKES